jgi:hypothetical protein
MSVRTGRLSSFAVLAQNRIVVCPCTGCELFRQRFRPIGWERALQQSRCRLLDLSDRLPPYVRAGQGLIVEFRHGLLFDDPEQGRGRRISERARAEN